MRYVLLILLFLPITIFGQIGSDIDSVSNRCVGDTVNREIFFVTEEMPVLVSGESISSYLSSQLFLVDSCCAFRAYVDFIIEVDSIITDRVICVNSVYCEDGLAYEGAAIRNMELKIDSILNDMPKLIPGRINGNSVAVKVSFPIHIDCFNR